MNSLTLANEIVDGRVLSYEDKLSILINMDLTDLLQGADIIRKHFVGDRVDLCTILNARSGLCGENCKFCAQSRHHKTACEVYELMDSESVIKEALANEEEGVNRFALVTSGHSPSDSDFEKIIHIYTKLKEKCNLNLCASLGFLSLDQFKRLHDVGITNYHNNIETSRGFFPEICTSHTFDDKIANIKRAQKAGLTVCSGGIIGMGESWEDRIDMALTLKDLGITSIPINSLMPIPGTPLENLPRLTEDDILRTIAIFRYINPKADIRLAGGRALMKENGKVAFCSGASASITGNMLTTCGSTIKTDKEMLKSLGRKL
ncbi:MAG: biotin synthase BioB [Eubacterium sp.]|nr:biotin synthase BioB [Eubacterium sp.]